MLLDQRSGSRYLVRSSDIKTDMAVMAVVAPVRCRALDELLCDPEAYSTVYGS